MMIRRKFFELTRRATRSFNVAACALALSSCATVTRIPYTQQERSRRALPPLWHALSSHRKGQPRPRTLIGALLIDRAADLAGQRDDQF